MKLDGAIGHIPYMLKIAIEIPTPEYLRRS
jgi:hypothetical protein